MSLRRCTQLVRLLALVFVTILPAPFTAQAQLPRIIGVVRSDSAYSYFGNRITGVGDQNGDGKADILVDDDRGSFLYCGGSPMSSTPAKFFDSLHWPLNVGDVDGDGYADFTAYRPYNQIWKSRIYRGGPGASMAWWRTLGTDALPGVGLAIACHDLNADGIPDYATNFITWDKVLLFEVPNPGDSAAFLILRPYWFTVQGGGIPFGDGLICGDFNGDGYPDLCISAFPNERVNASIYFYWGGPEFDSVPDFKITHPGTYMAGNNDFGKVLVNLGDVNGDGFDDIFVGPGNSYDTTEYVYFGGRALDTVPDVTIPDHALLGAAAGDINGDGYKDLLTSQALSYAGFVSVYFGGPHMDSIPDITIWAGQMPEYIEALGLAIAGVGDVDGDGIDDWAVSGVDITGKGVVYIFAGQKSPTGVHVEPSSTLPKEFGLRQNYPNPFNPSTQIRFSLPTRSSVRLIIYNIAGQVVTVPVNAQLAAGTYSVDWDGTDDAHKRVASGVYLYRMEAGVYTESKKMVLLK